MPSFARLGRHDARHMQACRGDSAPGRGLRVSLLGTIGLFPLIGSFVSTCVAGASESDPELITATHLA